MSNAFASAPRDLDMDRFWREVLRDFTAGGQSVRAFCREREVSEQSFYAWRRAIAQRDSVRDVARNVAAQAFVPVRLSNKWTSATVDATMEIELLDGSPKPKRVRRPSDGRFPPHQQHVSLRQTG